MSRKPIIPVKDLEILSTPQGAMIVLWTIRNNGPVGFGKVFEYIVSGEYNTASTSAQGTAVFSLASAARAIAEDIKLLYDSGLVEISDAQGNPLGKEILDGNFRDLLSAKDNVTLSVSSRLEFLQELLKISITDYASGKQANIKIEPSFGRPRPGDWPEAFVIMPFQETLRPIYEEHILPVARSLDLTCKRGDDFYSDDTIMDEVWSAIYHSKVCIAECTGLNANVFYEMGIAHTLGRSCILIAQSIEDLPFDIRHRRIIVYENTSSGLRKFRDSLKKAIQDELGMERDRLREILDKLD
jgi:hypothetical protein